MSRRPDPYAILGIDPRADDDAVKRAYRRGVLAWHPDVSSAPDACEKLREVQWAWEMIGEPDRRRGWDEHEARRTWDERPRRPRFQPEVLRSQPAVETWDQQRPRRPRSQPAVETWDQQRPRRPRSQPRDETWERGPLARQQLRDLFVELELTPYEAARGMVVPIEISSRTCEVVVPAGAEDGARGSMWLEEGRSRLHVILRVR